MATTHQDTNVNKLVINKMTKQEYDNLSQVSETELYLIEEQVDSVVTQNSTNPVQSGAVYNAIQNIGGNINDGTTTFTKNQEIIGTTSANQSVNQTIALPNDVVMCNLIDNKALASYATPITRFKYIEDHGWVDMDRSNIQYNEGTGEWTGTFVSLDITEGEYYYDMDNDTVFVADENSEMQDVTSTVIIQGDSNKLYCDTTTNMLYRYDGINFVALTSEGKTYTLSSNNENIRLTDSDGQTQDLSLNTLINGLSLGNSDPQDDDFIVAQYAGGGTTTTTYHRRPLSKFWNWIKSKLGIGTNDGTFLRKDGTWATPTDTKATVTTTGSGNAITSLTASNGALTATKGSTFLTSHQDISGKVSKSGDTMSGTLTFTTANAINYNANNGNINMIRFKTGDVDGHGIIIGGGGLTVIGAGESASTVAAQASSGGSETMQVCSDNNIEFYTNCQSGFSSAKKSYLDTSGNMYVNGSQVRTGTVAIANGGTGATTAAAARTNLGLGSAATLTANTAASNSTVVQRNASGYVYANYFNTTCAEANPSSYTSPMGLFTSNDGFIRKASAANFRAMIGAGTSSLTIGQTATTACAGNDSRLSNSRPASDVYAWAKASTKPSYTASEVGALAQTVTAVNGSSYSGTSSSSGVSGIMIGSGAGAICIYSVAIRTSSSSTSISIAVPGTYQHITYSKAGDGTGSEDAVLKLTVNGYIQNESTLKSNHAYYCTLIGIRKT